MSDNTDLVARLRKSSRSVYLVADSETADAMAAAFTDAADAIEALQARVVQAERNLDTWQRKAEQAEAALARADALLRECNEALIHGDSLLSLLWHRHVTWETKADLALSLDVNAAISKLRKGAEQIAAYLRDREGGAPPVECRCGTCADWNEGDSFVRLHDSRYVARCDCERSEDYENMHSAQHGCPQWSAKKGGGA